MSNKYSFFIDVGKCSGCKTCQVACKDKNDLPVGIIWRRVYEISKGKWKYENECWNNDIVAYNLSISCNHCEDPICVEVCPTTAMMQNDEGIVFTDSNKCIGCKYCQWSCPYGSPKYDEIKGIMTKCNFCIDYISIGKKPSCVDACPMRVLDFGKTEELEKKYGKNSDYYPLPNMELTKPSLITKDNERLLKSEDNDAKIVNKEEV